MIKKPNEYEYTDEQKERIKNSPAIYKLDTIRKIQEEIQEKEEIETEIKRIANIITDGFIQFFNETDTSNIKLSRSYEIAYVDDEYIDEFIKVLKIMLSKRKYLEKLESDERGRKISKFLTLDTVKIYITLNLICLNINLQRYKK